MRLLYYVIITAVVAAIAIYIDFYIRKNVSAAKISNAEEEAKKIVCEAEKTAESKKKEAILEAKEEVHKLRNDFEKESRDRRNEIQIRVLR